MPRIQKTALMMMLALSAVLILFALPDSAAAAKRLALVMGNSNYTGIEVLKNATNDATAISRSLKKLGFKVTLLKDMKSADFWVKLEKFVKEAENAESVLFFYSGHAFQVNGTNYLVPVNAKLQSVEAITTETWSLDGIIQRLQDRNRQTLIFLDACRNNPLPESTRISAGASANGLARLQTGTGTFVAFATSPGDVTFDGTGKNSPFTTALLDNIATPGISISDMMIEVRNDVEEKTFRKQIPWDQSSLRSQFYFKEVREKRPGLTAGDFEMLASLPAADREKMLKLLEASGIDTSAMADVVAAVSASLAVVEDSGFAFGDDVSEEPDEGTAVAEQPTKIVVAAADPVDVVKGGIEIFDGEDEPVVDVVDIAKPPQQVIGGPLAPSGPATDGTQQVIRLAALTSTTRSVPLFNLNRMRITGEEVSADTEEGRAILVNIDPSLLEELRTKVTRKDVKAIQRRLKDLGCYRSRVDGAWGKGSKTALSRYFIVKKIVPDTLDPTLPLLRQLELENNVVCEVSVARTSTVRALTKEPVKTGGGRKKATTVKQKKKLSKSSLLRGAFR